MLLDSPFIHTFNDGKMILFLVSSSIDWLVATKPISREKDCRDQLVMSAMGRSREPPEVGV